MNYLDTLLFGYYPYICLAVFFLGSLIRFDRDQYTWKSDSSQLLRAGQLRLGNNLFHAGVLFLFFGHFFGMLTPHAVYEHFIGAGAKQLMAMVSGGIAGVLGIIGLSRSIALDMAAFNVRSNCISPFAWTRMIGTIPADTDAQKARLERSKRMTPAKIAPMAVFLLSDAAEGISSQIFGVRMNEIMLFNANRPVRSVHNSEGWTLEAIAEHAVPSMKPFFTDLKRSPEYFTWDPI